MKKCQTWSNLTIPLLSNTSEAKNANARIDILFLLILSFYNPKFEFV